MWDQDEKDYLVAIIERLVRGHHRRVSELWDWGYFYHMDIKSRHRWVSDTLHGFWLAPSYELADARIWFGEFRESLESLDVIDRIEVEYYEEDADFATLFGELWKISFREDACDALLDDPVLPL